MLDGGDMIIIDRQTRGRHGNKVFHFNTLMQLSHLTGQQCFTDCWDGYEYFDKTCEVLTGATEVTEIPFSDPIYKSQERLAEEYSEGNWRLHTLSRCGPFFRMIILRFGPIILQTRMTRGVLDRFFCF